MEILNVVIKGARGGQGASTVAAALAINAASYAPTCLISRDIAGLQALLGQSGPEADATSTHDRLQLTDDLNAGACIRVIDGGTAAIRAPRCAVRLAVLRGPCYVALSSLVRHAGEPADGLVVMLESGRSLTARDAAAVTGIAVVATVDVTPAAARVIDAGLFVSRVAKLGAFASLAKYAAHLFAPYAHDASPPTMLETNASRAHPPTRSTQTCRLRRAQPASRLARRWAARDLVGR